MVVCLSTWVCWPVAHAEGRLLSWVCNTPRHACVVSQQQSGVLLCMSQGSDCWHLLCSTTWAVLATTFTAAFRRLLAADSVHTSLTHLRISATDAQSIMM